MLFLAERTPAAHLWQRVSIVDINDPSCCHLCDIMIVGIMDVSLVKRLVIYWAHKMVTTWSEQA